MPGACELELLHTWRHGFWTGECPLFAGAHLATWPHVFRPTSQIRLKSLPNSCNYVSRIWKHKEKCHSKTNCESNLRGFPSPLWSVACISLAPGGSATNFERSGALDWHNGKGHVPGKIVDTWCFRKLLQNWAVTHLEMVYNGVHIGFFLNTGVTIS